MKEEQRQACDLCGFDVLATHTFVDGNFKRNVCKKHLLVLEGLEIK